MGLIKRIKIIVKKTIAKMRNLSKHVNFKAGANISISSKFEGYNLIGENTSFKGELGKHSYIGDFSEIDGHIGRYCSIAAKVCVIQGKHPVSDFVSTSPMFYSVPRKHFKTFVQENKFDENAYANQNRNAIEVGNDVWIGYDSQIMAGVHIGNGAIIGARALVTKDVAPYSIVVGIPAKEIKKRFTDEEIDFLERFKWWEKDEAWIKNHLNFFDDIKDLMKVIGDKNENM